jgi:hypothetical protein
VRACVMADEEAGVVDCYETNTEGHVIHEPGKEPQLLRKFGTVRIDLGAKHGKRL